MIVLKLQRRASVLFIATSVCLDEVGDRVSGVGYLYLDQGSVKWTICCISGWGGLCIWIGAVLDQGWGGLNLDWVGYLCLDWAVSGPGLGGVGYLYLGGVCVDSCCYLIM